VTSADPVAATQPTRDLMRDLVIVAPLVVAAGLAVGALGIQAHVSETRIATDMGVAWALAAAALVTLGRPRRRRATWLLAAAAFALLGADLEWADTHAWWTLGLVFEQLWIAVLAVFDAHSGIGSASGHGHRRRSRGSPNRHWLRTSRPAPSTGCARRDARDRQPADTRDNGPRRAPMRVVIADDAPLIREGVTRLLTENAIEVVAHVGDADALLACVRELRPDVALVDVRMPPTHTDEGLRAAYEIRSHSPGTAVLVLSQDLEPAYALRLIDQQPERTGYLMKERVGRVEELLDALERVAAGGCVVDRAIVEELLARRRQGNPLDALTPREREILALIAEGARTKASAGFSG